MSDVPSVSVVIPVRNDAAALPVAVASVLAQVYDGPVDVTLAVGPSDDDSESVAQRLADDHAQVRVVDNPTGSTPAALNAAIDASTGEVVVRVDARSVLPEGYIRHAVEVLLRSGAGNVGGIQDPVGSTPFERAAASAMRSPIGAGGAAYRTGGVPGPVDTVYLGVFRRDALEAVGGFDEALERNQDYELNWRLRDAGWVVWFDPDLRVAYRPRGSLRALASQYASYGRWKCEVIRRHPRSARARQLVPPVAVVALGGATLGALARPRLLAVPAAYVAVLVAGGIAASTDEPPAVRARVPIALGVMHLSWGASFLVELVSRSLRRPAGPSSAK